MKSRMLGYDRMQKRTHEVITVVIKNWDPLVSLPAFAMLKSPGRVCFSLKFSSGNLSP